MDKLAINITRALVIEFGLIGGLYIWNWLGSNLLPEILQVFLVFQNVKNVIIEEATRGFNIFGFIIVCFLRGWLYFYAHLLAFGVLDENCYTPLNFSKIKVFLCNIIIAFVILIGVTIIGFPDKGQCFIAVYYASLVFVLFTSQLVYNKEFNKREKERKDFAKEIAKAYSSYSSFFLERMNNRMKEEEENKRKAEEERKRKAEEEKKRKNEEYQQRALKDMREALEAFYTKKPVVPKTKNDSSTCSNNKTEIDRILDKVRKRGYDSLTNIEKNILFNKKP